MRFTVLAAAALIVSAPALAQSDDAQRPAALKRVVDCRSVADQTARLACYDREVAALDAAQARNDLVIVDRGQIRTARRTLFGLPLPNLAIFGNNDGPEEEGINRLETKIKSVTTNGQGKWVFTLQDGGVWNQVDSRELPVEPRAGQDIRIRRAAMGSYLANVHNQTAIRVQRVR